MPRLHHVRILIHYFALPHYLKTFFAKLYQHALNQTLNAATMATIGVCKTQIFGKIEI